MLMGTYEAVNALLTAGQATTTYYYSSADLYDVFGRGETLVIQVVADGAGSATTQNVTVNLEGGNDGKVWNVLQKAGGGNFTVLLGTTGSTVFPASNLGDTRTAGVTLPAKVRVKVSLDTGNLGVRVIVSVRGEVAR